MEQMFKVSEVADMFKVQKATIREWLNNGTLKGVKIGNGHYWRIPASEVDRLGTARYGDKNG